MDLFTLVTNVKDMLWKQDIIVQNVMTLIYALRVITVKDMPIEWKNLVLAI